MSTIISLTESLQTLKLALTEKLEASDRAEQNVDKAFENLLIAIHTLQDSVADAFAVHRHALDAVIGDKPEAPFTTRRQNPETGEWEEVAITFTKD